ncbi:hypothetical protein LEN26_000697 [Aphanomyces euteiches]|nr:hypothetical protein LEN26_000697 [Aphanomyces euteiches]
MLRHSIVRSSQWRVSHARPFSQVNIGGVTASQAQAKEAHLVPRGFADRGEDGQPHFSQETLGHLRWMLQKDILHQDVFLIGPPGPARRRLALQFCEIMNREVEYIALSQDTTESDLKQRREILGGAAVFADQAPVRAAVHGRILILDGLEKAERNVLPTLNNLLENREMALEDGRYLMKASSFDALLSKGYSEADLEAQNLLRVHPAFRVIALGVPVPPFPGRTLDPPLRSRFQARQIMPPSPGTLLELCATIPEGEKLVSLIEAVHLIENSHDGTSSGNRMPHLNPSVAEHCTKIIGAFPETCMHELLKRLFPLYLTSWKQQSAAFERILDTFFPSNGKQPSTYEIKRLSDFESALTIDGKTVSVASGGLPINQNLPEYVETKAHRAVLTEMLKDHAVGSDLCIIGSKGSGKSSLARLFCTKLGYSTELFTLFKDMTARDLFQRRATDNNGNTTWEDSPLMRAARLGHVAILDGVHRLSSDTLSTLQRLIQDREVDLADGTKFLGSEHESSHGFVRIHPSFRVIALAEVGQKHPWLNSETLALFPYHSMPSLTSQEVAALIERLFPHIPPRASTMLLQFWHEVQTHPDLSLSLRQVLRMARRLSAFPETAVDDLCLLIEDTTMMHYLPAGKQMEAIMDKCKIPRTSKVGVGQDLEIVENKDFVKIGHVTYPIPPNETPRLELIPQPLYFDIPKHTIVMQQMLQNIVSGQPHLLLIGNQGVGKNKVVDRLLQLMMQEREYIQLHRDTTVQTLTLVPSLENGKITWEDSPLVKAVKYGRTLVVDEADKAPLEVVCVLKGLIEDGEMLLGDGRRIIDPKKVSLNASTENTIAVHPSFRMWVLANRPGYPFLGNTFFSEVGDIFATHVIDNPDPGSELALLRAYAPNVSEDVLTRLCSAFSELRVMVEEGSISYPYSTREAVAVAKHLEAFPNDGVSQTLENVLAFDGFDPPLRQRLREVFARHGIPLLTGEPIRPIVSLASAKPLPEASVSETWKHSNRFKEDISSDVVTLKPRRIYVEPPTSRTFSINPHRLHTFSEEIASWNVPLYPQQTVTSMVVLPDSSVHALTKQPLGVNSYFGVDKHERKHLYSELEGGYGYSRTDAQLMAWNNSLVLHIPDADLLLLLSKEHHVKESRILPRLTPKQPGAFQWNSVQPQPVILPTFLNDLDIIVRFDPGHSSLQELDLSTMKCRTYTLPFPLHRVDLVSHKEWHLHDSEENVHIMHLVSTGETKLETVDSIRIDPELSTQHSTHIESSSYTHPNAYLQEIQSVDDQTRQVTSSKRAKKTSISKTYFMDESNIVVNHEADSLLEIIDTNSNVYQQIQKASNESPVVDLAALSMNQKTNLLSAQADGRLRVWQVDSEALQQDLKTWMAMFDLDVLNGTKEPLSLKYLADGTSVPRTGVSLPKHGKEDPKNEPHVGGNTWAGGTGGSDTAGLGGRGGPYRLDKGHRIHQISQEKKDEVTKEAREKAKKMAQEALAEQLQQIDMTNNEFEAYHKYLNRIESETVQLRQVFQYFEQLSKERGWLKHQSNGEWDD